MMPSAHRLAAASLLALISAAPTVGDIGGCGQPPAELDAQSFFTAKANLDCTRCQRCALDTEACTRACDSALEGGAFPSRCVPLVHDGEVCLRALSASDCDDYAEYMSDVSPVVPTECNFCPDEGAW